MDVFSFYSYQVNYSIFRVSQLCVLHLGSTPLPTCLLSLLFHLLQHAMNNEIFCKTCVKQQLHSKFIIIFSSFQISLYLHHSGTTCIYLSVAYPLHWNVFASLWYPPKDKWIMDKADYVVVTYKAPAEPQKTINRDCALHIMNNLIFTLKPFNFVHYLSFLHICM